MLASLLSHVLGKLQFPTVWESPLLENKFTNFRFVGNKKKKYMRRFSETFAIQ